VQRQQNMEVQSALNYFNYPVGTVDGSLGPRSQAAIRQFEADHGFYADGYLDDAERAFLTSSYHRGISGNVGPHGAALAQGGTRGLLGSFNRERTGQYGNGGYGNGTVGGYDPNVAGQGYAQPGLQGQGGFNPNYSAAAVPAVPQMPTAIPEVPAVPVLPGAGQAQLPTIVVAPQEESMNQYCDATNRLSLASGGVMVALNVASNPGQALGEQFCLARSYTIAAGEQKMQAVSGMTTEQIGASCDALTTAMGQVIASLPTSTPEAAIQSTLALGGGQSKADLANLGEICLGLGFGDDKPSMSLASSLLLVAADKPAYAEFVGHQLRGGFGTAENPAQAEVWYRYALNAMDHGATPDVLPGQAVERYNVIRAALGGAIDASSGAGGTLPTFVVAPARN
jgi:peptidoglycan hydrolase-like protein with peptidoglycan-binding domain